MAGHSPQQVDDKPGQPVPADETQATITAVQASFHSGPLPDPATLEYYNRVHPGLAERIVARFEIQAEHRQAIEVKVVDAQIADDKAARREAWWGQIFGFLIGTITVVVGGLVAVQGAQWAGGFIGSSGVVGLVAVFVYGRRSKKNESDDDDKGE